MFKAPPKMKIYMWLVVKERILTSDLLGKKEVDNGEYLCALQ